MRIKRIQNAVGEIQKNVQIDDKRNSIRPVLEFKRQFTDIENACYEKYIKDLAQKIIGQGEILGKKADIREMHKYREMIARLLNETAGNAYTLKKQNRFDSSGRHKVLIMICKVNQNLDKLTAELLKEQSDNIKIMGMVDEIKGLLVDLFL